PGRAVARDRRGRTLRHAGALRAFAFGAYARGARESLDSPFDVPDHRLELGEGVEVGEQPEAEVAVVAHDRDPERLAARERDDGVEDLHLPPQYVQRELRPGDVRDHEVE